MRLPSDIRVGAFTFQVRVAKLEDAYGETDREELTVTIDPERNKLQETLQETLIHELLHCCVHSAGLSGVMENEELLVSVLSPTLTQVLRENKQLLKLISKETTP